MTPLVQVDAFTADAFAGNPAAVCVLTQPRDERWMQLVAREMNLSETAFVVLGDPVCSLRWFTPAAEVDLCGHATLASAHVLWEQGLLAVDRTAAFDTRSGRLTARRLTAAAKREGSDAVAREGSAAVEREGFSRANPDIWIELDFPATPDEPVDAPAGLAEALGAAPAYVGRSRFDFLVEVRDEQTVRTLSPDFAALRAFRARGVIVTARASTPGADLVSRYFAPAYGIDEDPVTGSTHCCLGPYWASRLGRTELVARQLSARGGVMKVAVDGDRVRLAGQAVTVLRGELAEAAG
jgi:predicted PhzF superfamily epimerase YddE/YHI9